MPDELPKENATTIHPTDVPIVDRRDKSRSLRQHYRKLRRDNQTGQSSKWGDRDVRMWKDRYAVLGAIAGQLELTEYQKERSRQLLNEVSDDTFRGNPVGLVALCVCGHVGREDGRDYHPNVLLSDEKSRFAELAEDFDVSHNHLFACWRRVGQEVDS